MKKLVLFTVSLFLMGAANIALGQRTITGKVTSAEEPDGVPMVAVQVEGTTVGTSTDFNGVFTLNNVPASAKNLKFSAMGLKEKIVPITGGVMNVQMESSAIVMQIEAGDNAGCLLRGIAKTDIERGQVLCKPGSIHPHTKFKGQVYVLSKDEGGRHTPFFNNYRPQFYFRTTDVTGVISLPEGTEMCMPGDNVDMKVELITPIAIENGLRFAIREGGRTVGSGVVIGINE